jgi:hypothetical protein
MRGQALAVALPMRSAPARLDLAASWRPIHHQKTSAIKIGGSPFKTLAEAEEACEAMLSRLVR